MDKMIVNSKEGPYSIYFEHNFDHFIKLCARLKTNNNKFVIIFDYNAYKLHGKNLLNLLLENNIIAEKFIIKASEKRKNLEQVEKIYDFLFDIGADRNTYIISFGGGIVGDIAGFVASTYKRGTKFIQIPTTLLACVDSSIGGKVGVNFKNKKNLIGAFYNPKFVYINVSLLETLDKRQYNCGMVEIIKHALLMNEDMFCDIENKKYTLINLIKKSCEIKAKVVEKDEKENSIRVILNLGHTIGHAIECATNFKYSHGEAVAIGILYSLKISRKLNKITRKDADRIKRVFDGLDVLPKDLKNISLEKVKKCIK